MVLHQVFRFNSPVWFNVGTPSKQHASGSIVLSVDDSMESTLDWHKEGWTDLPGRLGRRHEPVPHPGLVRAALRPVVRHPAR